MFVPSLNTFFGEPGYVARLDLNIDGTINVLDLFELVPLLATQCTD
jgi:hypothetical protein